MIEKQLNMDELKKHMEFTNKLYDVARIVDPIRKQVLEYKEDQLVPLESLCYDFWRQDGICNNCISIRAFQEEETFAKVEYNGKNIYMTTAIPIFMGKEKIVLELLRDVSHQAIFFDLAEKPQEDVYKLIKERNEYMVKDALTKVYNRRYLNERLPYEMVNNNIKGQYTSLLMVDIDDFRSINETYGHECGNHLLKSLAQVLQGKIKEDQGEWLARYQADSFVLFLKNTSPREIETRAMDIGKTIEEYGFNYKGDCHGMTVCIGGYSCLSHENSVDKLVEKVEMALQQAKAQGKNGVLIHREDHL